MRRIANAGVMTKLILSQRAHVYKWIDKDARYTTIHYSNDRNSLKPIHSIRSESAHTLQYACIFYRFHSIVLISENMMGMWNMSVGLLLSLSLCLFLIFGTLRIHIQQSVRIRLRTFRGFLFYLFFATDYHWDAMNENTEQNVKMIWWTGDSKAKWRSFRAIERKTRESNKFLLNMN